MLALANRQGYVAASVGGLAHEARVDRETCEKALKVLSSKDEDSRSKEFEGRRIEVVEGGFQLLNYEKYRSMRAEEDRREYMKTYMVEYRRTKNVSKKVNNVSECKPSLSAVNRSKPPLAAVSPSRGRGEAEAEETQNREKESSSPLSKFNALWKLMYKQDFGVDYVFQGRDGRAAADLMKFGMSPEELIDIARKAWTMRDKFFCKNAVSLPGFVSQFNSIRAEVGLLKPVVKSEPILRPSPIAQEAK